MYKHLYECNIWKAAQERVILSDKEERRQAKGPVNREDIERELSDIWFSSIHKVLGSSPSTPNQKCWSMPAVYHLKSGDRMIRI